MPKKPFVGPLKLELVVAKMGVTKMKAWKWVCVEWVICLAGAEIGAL